MTLVRVDMRKWPKLLHWQFEALRLGEDEHGTWLHVPSNTIAKRGTEPSRPIGVGFVGLVPKDSWWVVEFYPNHPWQAVYVNIGTPPEWDGNRVQQVDLDLDVVRKVDGSVAVLDEDEFAEHQVAYSYPSHLITAAVTATNEAIGRLERNQEPFGLASAPWIAEVDPETLR